MKKREQEVQKTNELKAEIFQKIETEIAKIETDEDEGGYVNYLSDFFNNLKREIEQKESLGFDEYQKWLNFFEEIERKEKERERAVEKEVQKEREWEGEGRYG